MRNSDKSIKELFLSFGKLIFDKFGQEPDYFGFENFIDVLYESILENNFTIDEKSFNEDMLLISCQFAMGSRIKKVSFWFEKLLSKPNGEDMLHRKKNIFCLMVGSIGDYRSFFIFDEVDKDLQKERVDIFLKNYIKSIRRR